MAPQVPRQSALGGERSGFTPRTPDFDNMQIGKVTDTTYYTDQGKISVAYLDGSSPELVWVVGSIDREPMAGDMVIVGYIGGRKDSPYLAGFIRNQSYTSNFIVVEKDKILLQLPVFGIGTTGSKAYQDASSSLLDGVQGERAFVELSPTGVIMSFPIEGYQPAQIRLTNEGFVFYHPTGGATMQIKGNMNVIDS